MSWGESREGLFLLTIFTTIDLIFSTEVFSTDNMLHKILSICVYMRIKFELEFNLVQTINGMREIIKHTLRVANNNNNKENNNSNRNNDNNKLLGHKKCLLLPAITLKSCTVTAATTKSV